ncbi:MAG: DUF6159 family protein [Myxococcales bacterium]|nr:DUF6159 family protein [Myxococcota bacterium]MDW8280387.1 DUF6159 family protein [Myxococcales bacterium]
MPALRNSWNLVKASLHVLGQDKELIWFPILSVLGVVVVGVGFVVPLFTAGWMEALQQGGSSGKTLGALLGFSLYLCIYFVILFCNAALVGAALIRLRGGDPTVGDGLRIAARHVGPIFAYALLSATIGLLLQALSNAKRAKVVGHYAASIFGAAWGVASFLVVPILVSERVGVLDAVRRSVQLLKKTWGEQLVGHGGMGVFFKWVTFLCIMVCGLGMFVAVEMGRQNLLLLFAGLGVTWVIGVALLSSALRGIYTAALYRFATEGQAGGLFDEDLVRHAFRSQ